MVGEFPGLGDARRGSPTCSHSVDFRARLQGPHGAVARGRRGRDRPGARSPTRPRCWCDEGAADRRRGGAAYVARRPDAAAGQGARQPRVAAEGAARPRKRRTEARRRAVALRRATARRRALLRAGAPRPTGRSLAESRAALIGVPAGAFAAPGAVRDRPGARAPATCRRPGPPAPVPRPPSPVLPPIYSNPYAVQVQGFEFGLQLSKATVSAGDVRVEFNLARAEDPHNLWLVREDGTGTPRTASTRSPPARSSPGRSRSRAGAGSSSARSTATRRAACARP